MSLDACYKLLPLISSTLFIRIIHISSLPLWIHSIPPHEFGLFELANSGKLLMTALCSWGLFYGFHHLFYATPTREEKQRFIGTLLWLPIQIGAPICIGIACFYTKIAHLFASHTYHYTILLGLIGAAYTYLYSMFFHAILVTHNKITIASITHVITELITLLCTAVFIVLFHYGVFGIFIAQCIGSSAGIILKAYYALPLCPPIIDSFFSCISRTIILQKKSWEYLATALSIILFHFINRSILASYSTLTEVGIYAVAAKVDTLLHECFFTPFFDYYKPYLFAQYQQQPAHQYEHTRLTQLILFIGISLVVSSFGYYLLHPIGRFILPIHYHAALPLSLLIAWGSLFTAATTFASYYLLWIGKKSHYTITLLIAHLLNGVLQVHLIPLYGAYGSALATTISSLCACSIISTISWWIYKKRESHITPARHDSHQIKTIPSISILTEKPDTSHHHYR